VIRTLAAGLVACLFAAGQASAAIVLDQADAPVSGSMNATSVQLLDLTYAFGQSFTVGLSGTLAQIDIPLFYSGAPATGGLDFEVLGPSNNLVFSTLINPAIVPDFSLNPSSTDWSQLVQIDTASADIEVTPGEQIKWLIVPGAGASNATLLDYLNGASFSYSGGQSLIAIDGGYYPSSPGNSFPFRTYVDTGPVAGVPEPSTWMLAIVGLGILGCALRRGRRPEADALA
jgi:hypothetical protein